MLNNEKEMNHEKWAGYVDAQKSSGLPQKKWCAANQVNHHNFRYWRQRLKKESAVKEGDPTDKSAENVEGSEIFEFAHIMIQPEGSDEDSAIATAIMPSITITIRGIVLNVTSTYDETFLLRLIRTLNRL